MDEDLLRALKEERDQNLKTQEQILESIVHGITDPVLLLSKDFTILLANKAFQDQTGYKPEEIIGNHCYKLTHHRDLPCEPPRDLCPVIEALKTGGTASITHTHFDREDKEIFVEIIAYPVKDEKGEISQFVYIYRDITGLKKTEEDLRRALSESKQRYAEISGLLEGTRTVLEAGDFNTAARSLFNSCEHSIGATAGYVALFNKDGTGIESLFTDSGRNNLYLPLHIQRLRETGFLSESATYSNNFPASGLAELIPREEAIPENFLLAPLLISGEVVGMLGLANKAGGFTEYDTQIASGFCKLAAFALIGKRTEETLRRAHDELILRVREQDQKLTKILDTLQAEVNERKRIEKESKNTLYNLTQRFKELTVLHQTESVLNYSQKDAPDILNKVVSFFPAAWQYPQITAARIVFNETEYKTPNFLETPWRQNAGFTTVDGKAGLVEISYLEKRPDEIEGPFSAEERRLINTLAETLKTYFNRKYAEDESKKYREHLEKLIEEQSSEIDRLTEQLQNRNHKM